MEKFFINLGRKLGATVNRSRWYYQSLFGSEDEALEAEYLMGKNLAASMEQEVIVIDDPALQALLDEIGGKLASKVVNKKRKFKFQAAASNEINAFALPGGFIFVTAALLKKVEFDRDAIAYILSHEIMHVVLKHPINRILRDYSAQIVSNIFLKGGTVGMIARQLIGNLLRSSYSQDNEFEADNYAVRLMTSAGFDPQSAKSVLQKLGETAPENLPIYNYFLSHPAVKERIEKIEKVIGRRQT